MTDINLALASIPGGEELVGWVPGDPLSILIYGPDNGGKTHFAFTAPDPIVLFDFEGNQSETLRSFAVEKNIRRYSYFVPMMGERDKAEAVANKFTETFHTVLDKLAAEKIKATIVIDSVTKCGDLLTYGYVPLNAEGKARQIAYGKRNMAYQSLFQSAKTRGHRLVVCGRSAPDYIDNTRMPTFHADVIESTLFDVSTQIEVMSSASNGKVSREYKIRRCKVNTKLEGVPFKKLDWDELSKAIEETR